MRRSSWPPHACAETTRHSYQKRAFMVTNRNGSDQRKGKGKDGKPLKVIGKPFRKVDARSKCTGQTKFADDITLPRMLFAKLLRSHEPHARIKSIDISKALQLPGVYSIITGRDLPIPYGILPVSQDEH